jgi:hypothetical protein
VTIQIGIAGTRLAGVLLSPFCTCRELSQSCWKRVAASKPDFPFSGILDEGTEDLLNKRNEAAIGFTERKKACRLRSDIKLDW